MKTGYVAIIGRPNVGKSTLLNQLVGQKLSITSRKPQTTRHRILGIKTTEDAQILYLDTPGIHQSASKALNRYLNKTANAALVGVDVIVWMIDNKGFDKDDSLIFKKLKSINIPVILVINKVDKVKDKALLLPLMQEAKYRFSFEVLIPVSALRGTNVRALEKAIIGLLPAGEPMYPEYQITDKPERFFAAEIIREKLLYYLGDEVPHRLTVEIEQFKTEGDLTRIYAVIWVEREGQKRIVIGDQGALLKKAGQKARLELEDFLGRRVYLNLWVKVKKGWSDDERMLQRLGYAE